MRLRLFSKRGFQQAQAVLLRGGALGGLLAAWALFSWGNQTWELVNPALIPTPLEVAQSGYELARQGLLQQHWRISLWRVAEGFGLAAAAAVTFGMLAGISKFARFLVEPIAASGQSSYNIAPQSDVAGTQQLVLAPRAKVNTPKDLEKLKIGMAKGASITMAIEAMCKATGVDFEKLQFINLAPPDQVTALAKGDIDAMAAWAPWVINAVKQARGKVYFTGNHSYIPGQEGPVEWLLVHAGVVSSGEYLQKYPNTLKAVLRALKRATATINDERDKVVPIVAKEMRLSEEMARDIMALNVYSMEMNEKIYRGMGEFAEFLYKLNRIPQKIDPASVFYTKLPEEVDLTLVKWKSAVAFR